MSLRAEIWLGDLVRCLGRLDPHDDNTRAAVRRTLGLEPLGAAPRPTVVPGETRGEALKAAPQTKPPLELESSVPSTTDAPFRLLEPVATGQTRGERPWESAAVLPASSNVTARAARRHRPLFAPGLQREMLIALASAARSDGEVNAGAVVDTAARGRPIIHLPRLPRRGLAKEVQLLLDAGSGMEPYGRDRWAVIDQFRSAVGGTRLTVLHFRDFPLRAAGMGPVWTWKPYVPPAEGATVIAVTDLGIGSPPLASRTEREDEWLRLAADLRRRCSHFVALVPYGRDRWPRRLQPAFPIVTWDRTTGVGAASRALYLARS